MEYKTRNMRISRKIKRKLGWIALGVFALMNVVAGFHAYKFTHFTAANSEKTKNPKDLTFAGKLNALCFGINNPKPTNKTQPASPYETIYLQSSQRLACWSIKVPDSKGTIAIFHGFSGDKAMMLDKSEVFNALGYSTFLVDFIGTGGSSGNETTIGYREAQDVKVCLDYLQQQGVQQVIAFGTSMGAAAILRAAAVWNIHPAAAILECPFGTMYRTTCARFAQMHVPSFPMAGLLVFWGGLENGFWAFSHNPQEYAKVVKFPTLLLYGEKDAEVSREEINHILANLGGKKVLRTYPEAGHENYLKRYKKEWVADVSTFLLNQ